MAEKRKRGRPRIIKTPEELYEYWEKYKKQVNPKVEYTTVGFTNFLRKEFKNMEINQAYYYQLNEDFSYTKKIIDEECLERSTNLLSTDFHGGRVFFMKNKHNWTDKQQIEQTNSDITIKIKKASKKDE